jgi:hypothetical protein
MRQSERVRFAHLKRACADPQSACSGVVHSASLGLDVQSARSARQKRACANAHVADSEVVRSTEHRPLAATACNGVKALALLRRLLGDQGPTPLMSWSSITTTS